MADETRETTTLARRGNQLTEGLVLKTKQHNHMTLSLAVAELITITPVYVCLCACLSISVCLLATDLLRLFC